MKNRCIILIFACLLTTASAQETFRNPALEPQDEAMQSINQGRALARQGNFAEAIKEFQKAASLKNNQCPKCYEYIGQAYFQMGKLKEAAEAYRQAIAQGPDNAAGLYNSLGVALYLRQDKKSVGESATAFQKAIELSNGQVVKAYYNLGYALIKLGKEQEGVEALKAYLAASPDAANAAEVRAVIADTKKANVQFAPGFKVTSLTGEELSLEKFRGKVVLLDFWAVWCGPCLRDMPRVKEVWRKYGGDNFVIIGISLDRREATLKDYLKQQGITWPQYFDGRGWDNKVSRLYGVTSIPHTVLIDHEGVIQAVGLRGGELSDKIGKLLGNLGGR